MRPGPALLAISLLVAGCADLEDRPLETVYRFVEEEPVGTYGQHLSPLTSSRDVFVWDCGDPEEQARWSSTRRRIPPIATARRTGARAKMDAVTLRRETDFDAATVDHIEFRVSAEELARSSAVLIWALADTPRTGDESINTRGTMTTDEAGHIFQFKVAGHPSWEGRISQISLRLFTERDADPELDVVAAETRIFSEQGLAEATRGFRVDLDDEVRSSLLALPGMDIERRLDLPRGARLRMAWGVHGASDRAIRFQVLGARGDDEPELLFETAVAPGPKRGRWHSAEVDLAGVIGRSSRLILRTEADGALDPVVGFPVWGHPEIVAPKGGFTAPEPPPNIVLISADTLRADRLSLYGHDRPTTPRLEAWADKSAAVFRDAVAPSPWTLPSHVSLFTGLDVHRHGVLRGPAPQALDTLAETLHAAGYSTAAISGGGYLHPSFGFAQGFDRYRFFGGRIPSNRRAQTEKTSELDENLAHAVQALDDLGDRPFFLFFHTFATHQPFQAREPWFSRFSELSPPAEPITIPSKAGVPEEGFRRYKPMALETAEGVDPVELLRDVYDSSVAFLDDRIAQLLSAIEERGLSGRTIVVFTSDHGELLGERGLASHYYLWEENILVPLLISAPGVTTGGQEVRQQVRVLDVYPTLLELVGLPVPEGLDGRSLVPLLDGRGGESREALVYAAASNHGIAARLDSRAKYIWDNTAWPPYSGSEVAYSLGPDGETEIPADQLERYATLRDRLIRRLAVESPGIDLVIDNGSEVVVRGTAAGPLVLTSSVKAIEMACDCVAWESAGKFSFDVPPGGRIALKIEGLARSGLKLQLEPGAEGRPAAFGTFLEPGADGTAAIVALLGDAWTSDPVTGGESEATISVSWTGPAISPTTTTAPDSDARLLERLRALGYLD